MRPYHDHAIAKPLPRRYPIVLYSLPLQATHNAMHRGIPRQRCSTLYIEGSPFLFLSVEALAFVLVLKCDQVRRGETYKDAFYTHLVNVFYLVFLFYKERCNG